MMNMKKTILSVITFLVASFSFGQHCPWDCSGMILMQTSIPKEKLYLLHPVLVDANKKEVIDTVYGTGLDTHDNCEFLSYEDFTDYRAKKIALHYFYQYDTFYHFAAGGYLVKYNFCKYEGKKLYLRFEDPHTRDVTFRYIEIPANRRMHLHEYNNALLERETQELKKRTQPFVLKVSCEEWKLWANECK